MSATTTPTLDARTRDAIERLGRQLAHARAVARLMQDDQGMQGIADDAAGAMVALIDNAQQSLGEIKGATT